MLQPQPNYRGDVISFESDVFDVDTTIFGRPQVHLSVSTDVDDTAFDLDYDTFKEEEKKLKAEDFNLELDESQVGENIENVTIDSETIE